MTARQPGRAWRSRLAVPLVVLAGLAAGFTTYRWAHRDDARLEETRQMGEVLVAAIESYRADHGEYPEALADLVPAYVARIERPSWGVGEWTYSRYEVPVNSAKIADSARAGGAGDVAYLFTLSVAANERRYPVLYYDLADRRWVLNN